MLLPYSAFVAVFAAVVVLTGRMGVGEALHAIAHDGGFGPGSYYVPLYAQYFLLLPLFALAARRRHGPAAALAAAIALQVAALHFCPVWLYRLLAVRYLPLPLAGLWWARRGIELTPLSLTLSALSAAALLALTYGGLALQPWLCTTRPWEYANWPCYAWPAVALPAALYGLRLRLCDALRRAVEWCGRRSLEIYMAQMAVFFFLPVETYLAVLTPAAAYTLCTALSLSLSLGAAALARGLSLTLHRNR